MNVINCLVLAAGCAAIAACGVVPEQRGSSEQPDAVPSTAHPSAVGESSVAAAGGAAEYRHLASVSRMATGPNTTALTEFGIDKWVGQFGVHALWRTSGLEMGLPNSDAPTLSRRPYGSSLAAHNEHVRGYFVGAGLPSNQVGAVSGHVGGTFGGPVGQAPVPVGPVEYYSVLSRQVAGIPVVNSFAWARINEDDDVVEESVYWPAIPESVIASARSLRGRFADANALNTFRSGLPGGAGRVVIQHSAASADAFQAEAAYEISASGGPRYFDASGVETSLLTASVHRTAR